MSRSDNQIATILISIFTVVVAFAGIGIYKSFEFLNTDFFTGGSMLWASVVFTIAAGIWTIAYLNLSGWFEFKQQKNKIKSKKLWAKYDDSIKQIEVRTNK